MTSTISNNGNYTVDYRDVSKAMCDGIIHHIDEHIPDSNIVVIHSLLYNLSSNGVIRIIKENENYRAIKSKSVSDFSFYGPNKCVIILPIEGIVVVTTVNIAMSMSGIHLWYSNPELFKNIRKYNIHDTILVHKRIMSPSFIITDLPSDSITLLSSTNSTITLTELLSKYIISS